MSCFALEWFYNGLGGIGQTEESIAYKKLKIEPYLVNKLKNSYASFESPYGKIISSWTQEKDAFVLETNIPVNTTATVVLPANKQNKILEDGIILDNQTINYQNNKAYIQVGSGSYCFEVQR